MTRPVLPVAAVLVALVGIVVAGCDDRDPPGVTRPGGVPVTVTEEVHLPQPVYDLLTIAF